MSLSSNTISNANKYLASSTSQTNLNFRLRARNSFRVRNRADKARSLIDSFVESGSADFSSSSSDDSFGRDNYGFGTPEASSSVQVSV